MNYIVFTYVDSVTEVPVSSTTPTLNGPKYPNGASFGFALESKYPTDTPTFYGTTEGLTTLPGIYRVITKDEYDEAYKKELLDRQYKGFIPPSLIRQRAQAIGIWDDLAAYLAQYPSLLLMVLTLENGIDPKYPDLINGFNELQVPQEIQDYLLSDPSRGV